MMEARHVGGLVGERLTWAEICARYPNEWVTMVDAEWVDEDFTDVRTAVVVVHSGDYAASFLGPELRTHFEESVHLFTGPRDAPSSWAR